MTVRNTGDSALHDVTVTDVTAPTCSGVLGTITAGDVQTITCAIAAAQDSFTNTVSVVAVDAAGQPVTGTDSVGVTVIHPGITLTKTGQSGPSLPGDPVTFILVASNTGDAVLSDVVIADPQIPGCRTTYATLAPGASTPAFTCTAAMPGTDWRNAATVTATDPSGHTVDAAGSASVPAGRTGLAVTKASDRAQAVSGQSVTFTITVRNTGTVALRNVRVSDSLVPACSRTLAALAAGEEQSWTCQYTMGSAAIRNTASGQACPASVNASGCPTPVVSALAVATVERKQAMAETGVSAASQAGLAVGLLVVGLALLLAGRRRRSG